MGNRKTTVILDGSHHGMRLIFGCKQEETAEEGYQLWRYLFLNGIFQFIDSFKADEFVIALDSKNNWRRKYFPYYKADRKMKRVEVDKGEGWFEYSRYYEEYDKLMNDIVENLPIKVLKVDTTEADDIAGVLSRCDKISTNAKIMVTTDQDYLQLMASDYVRIFNPQTKVFMKCADPKEHLLMKVILGDKGDFVPSIADRHILKPEFLEYCVNEGLADNANNAQIKLFDDEDLLITTELNFQRKYGIKPSRVMCFSKKLATSLLESGTLKEHLEKNPSLKERFVRNNRLVNLTAQPKNVTKEIIELYENYEMKAGINKLFEFFIANNFNKFLDDSEKLGALLEPLCE